MEAVSVFELLFDDPDEARDLTLRADAMRTLIDLIKSWNITQKEAAKKLGITQPRLNDLLKGKIDLFSLDTLIKLAGHAGLIVTLEFKKAA